MKYVYIAILTSAGFALSGCSATGPVFKEAAPAPAGKALVYIYRPNSFVMGGRDAHFFVDGEELIHLSNSGYTQTYLPEGHHQIMERWNDNIMAAIVLGGSTKTVELPLDVKAGEVYYFRFNTGMGGYVYNAIQLTWQLQQVSPEIGAIGISQTKYQPAKR
ncbi:hypothetical protein AAKU55_005897 [Oxalobacteraceae bacterium GrIS 1.11]